MTDTLTAAVREIALARGTLPKLAALKAGAKKLAVPVRHGFIERSIVFDALVEQSRNCGLGDDPGETVVVEIIAAGLRDFELHDPAEPSPAESAVEFGLAGDRAEASGPGEPSPNTASVVFKTPAEWGTRLPPPVQWLADQRIPRGEVTTLHGDGGAGKTDLLLLLAAAVAREAQYWLGHAIQNGPAVVISAEEPEREIERRMKLHAARDGYDVQSLTNLHLWFPDEDSQDVALVTADRMGMVRPTALFSSIEMAIRNVRPVLVAIDNVAATYIGSQIDRSGARGYNNLLRRIARGANLPAVLLLDHPSLSGITTGSGRSGNMDWRNAPRSALYLKTPDNKAEADAGIRVLETVKNNYAKRGNPIRLQWTDGGLTLEATPSSLHRLVKDAECEAIFLRLLDERAAQGRDVSDKPSKTYAPTIFVEMDGANRFTSDAFARAMERLFHACKITLKQVGPPSKRRTRIVRAAPPRPAD